MTAEEPRAYRERLLRPYQKHSKEFSAVDLHKLDSSAFGAVEGRIYADAIAASERPEAWSVGPLREIKKVDKSGRVISSFVGSHSFVEAFKMPVRRIAEINGRLSLALAADRARITDRAGLSL